MGEAERRKSEWNDGWPADASGGKVAEGGLGGIGEEASGRERTLLSEESEKKTDAPKDANKTK